MINREENAMIFGGWKRASLALIPLSLILIALFVVLDIRVAADSPVLLLVLQTVFVGIIPLFITFLAFRSYRLSGSASLLLIGSGMLMFGIGSLASGWVPLLFNNYNISELSVT